MSVNPDRESRKEALKEAFREAVIAIYETVGNFGFGALHVRDRLEIKFLEATDGSSLKISIEDTAENHIVEALYEDQAERILNRVGEHLTGIHGSVEEIIEEQAAALQYKTFRFESIMLEHDMAPNEEKPVRHNPYAMQHIYFSARTTEDLVQGMNALMDRLEIAADKRIDEKLARGR